MTLFYPFVGALLLESLQTHVSESVTTEIQRKTVVRDVC